MKNDTGTRYRHRPETRESHLRGVVAALALMRERYREPLALGDLAGEAHMSPYHFVRVFKGVTLLSPMQFLAAIRVAAAKQLLLETDRSVTNVCWDVGYESLGSFSAHFTEMVGVSPREWRTCMATVGREILRAPLPWVGEFGEEIGTRYTNVAATGPFGPGWLLCAGVFPRPIPFGRPKSCALAIGCRARLDVTSTDGTHLFAICFGPTDISEVLLGSTETCLVGSSELANVCLGTNEPVEITMRKWGPLDPPILSALPLFLASRLGAEGSQQLISRW
jgi:AraC-like DNA-binding protein